MTEVYLLNLTFASPNIPGNFHETEAHISLKSAKVRLAYLESITDPSKRLLVFRIMPCKVYNCENNSGSVEDRGHRL